MSTYDMDTEYTVSYVPEGFTLMVNYRYDSFTVRSSVVAKACKGALANVANSLAQRRQRQIEPLNEQRISVTTSRSWWGRVTACTATAPIVWKS